MNPENKVLYCRFKCETQVYYDTTNHKYFPTEILTKKVHNYTRCADALRARGKEIPGFFKDKMLRETTHTDIPESYKKFPFYTYLRINAYNKVEVYLKEHWLDCGFLSLQSNTIEITNELISQTQNLKTVQNTIDNVKKVVAFNDSLDRFF